METETTDRTSIAITPEQKACLEKLVTALRSNDRVSALSKLCCTNWGTWSERTVSELSRYLKGQGFTKDGTIKIPEIGSKIDFCDGNGLWKMDTEPFSMVAKILETTLTLPQTCEDCKPETDTCCDYAGVYAGLGLAAAIVFERIEMGKKVRGENNKHGVALGLVLGIILLLIISNIGSSVSGVWLLALAAVVFIGMSIIQGKFMQQYSLNKNARFDDFSSDTSENVVEQSFFTNLDGNQAF